MKLLTKQFTTLLFLIMSCLLYSIDDGVKLEKLGEWRTFGYSHAAVQGKYAYFTRSLGGVDIFDVDKKNKPVFKGNYALATGSSVITISGKYAVVAVNDTHIEILDISDPSNSKRVGVYRNDFSQINGLWLNGNFLYIRAIAWKSYESQGLLDIVDISDPSNPKSTASFEGERIRYGKFNISGNYMYIPCILEKELEEDLYLLRVYNISNPSSPQFIKQFDIVSDLKTFYPEFTAVSGNKILWSRSGEMKLLDISDPLQPSVLESTFKKEYHSMLLSGHYVYLFNEAKLEVTDVSNPVNPVNVSSLTVKDPRYLMMECESNGALFCVTDDYKSDAKGFDIFDISNPSAPVKSGSIYEPGRNCILHHTVLGKYAYLADGLRGLHILDISNPAAPAKLGLYISNGTNACRVAAYKSYAYLIDSGGLEIIDVSNKSAPVLTGSCSLGELSDPEIAIIGNVAIVKNAGKILVIDVTTKTAPSVVSTYDNGSVIHDMKAAGNYAYIAVKETTDVIDISNKSMPSKVASIPGSGKITIYGNYLYIIINGLDSKIQVVDISNPTQPVASGTYKSMDIIKSMTVFGNFAYLTFKYNDFLDEGIVLGALDVSNPSSPRQIYYNYSLPTGSCMSSDGSNLYISTTSLVVDATGGDGFPGLFSILKIVPTPASWIQLISPNGGESLPPGGTYDIRWTNHNYPDEVSCILLSGEYYYDAISAEWIEPGLLRWKIPTTIPEGNIYRIKIQGKNHIFDVSDDYFWIKPNWSSCSMNLNRKKLNFGSTSGQIPPKQEVVINALCVQSFGWSARCDESWMSVTPGSGDGSGAILVGVDPSGLAEGTYTGKVIIASTQAGISSQEVTVTFKVMNNGTAPFGEFSTPVSGSAVNGSVPVTGWALDDVSVSTVKIYRDPVSGEENKKIYIGDAIFVEGARPDVETAYPGYPDNDRAGWGYMLLTHFLPGGGNGSYTLYAIGADNEGNETTLGTRVFTCNNAQADEPFGAIDTPAPGGVVSGKDFENFGWALTPPPNMIPIDGNTITVWIDGKPAGKPIYGDYREDIASLFPGYLNIEGAGGHFYFNSSAYPNGLHTISWSVKDNAGNEQGIGSRFFSIRNKIQYPIAANHEESENHNPGISNLNTRVSSIEIEETGRLELYLFDESTHKNNTRTITNISKLPIGSTLDKNQGVFYWQPAPGFIGNYQIEFIEKTPNSKNIKRIVNIKIIPKFN